MTTSTTAAVRTVIPQAVVTCIQDDPAGTDAARRRNGRRGRPLNAVGSIADALRELNWTRRDLASAAGISLATVAALLAGRTPQLETARRIGDALDVDPMRLFR